MHYPKSGLCTHAVSERPRHANVPSDRKESNGTGCYHLCGIKVGNCPVEIPIYSLAQQLEMLGRTMSNFDSGSTNFSLRCIISVRYPVLRYAYTGTTKNNDSLLKRLIAQRKIGFDSHSVRNHKVQGLHPVDKDTLPQIQLNFDKFDIALYLANWDATKTIRIATYLSVHPNLIHG